MGPQGRRTSRRYPGHRRSGRMVAVGGAVLAVLVLGLGIGLAGPAVGSVNGAGSGASAGSAHRALTVAAQARIDAPTTAVTTTAAGSDQVRTVTVSPYTALAASGAQITVTGKGFDSSKDLWVAVCAADGVAPAALIHCMGGAIPDGNETTGWGIVSSQTTAPYPGPVLTKWTDGGSFTMTLVLPAAIGDAVDCVKNPCEVVTRSSDDSDRSADVVVPVTFAAPPTSTVSSTATSSSPTSTVPTTTLAPSTSTSTIGASATTVPPNSMLQTSLPAGGDQVVVFTGFIPGEGVAVTLFSDPISLPAVTADGAGTVRIEFTLPADLSPGLHILQAVGAQSRRVGIAQFTVTAATTESSTPATSATSATSSSPSPTTSSQTSSEEATTSSETSSAEPTTSLSVSSPTATPTVATTTAAGGEPSSNNLLWLWITLGVVVVVGAVAGIVAMIRSRRDDDDDLPPLVAADAPQPPSPGWSAGEMSPPGPTYLTEPGGSMQDYGLLSGVEPELLSGRGGPDAATELIGPRGLDQPTQYIPPAGVGERPPFAAGPAGPGGPGGSPTMGPDPASPPSAGPATESWTPDFTAGQPTAPAQRAPQPDPGGPSTQAWVPDFTGQQAVAPQEGPEAGGSAVSGPDEQDEPPAGGGRHHRSD